MNSQVLQNSSTIDWREVIAGGDGTGTGREIGTLRRRRSSRRELGLGAAIVIAACLEVALGIIIAAVLAWSHQQQHGHRQNMPLSVHLVTAASLSQSSVMAKGGRANPSAGRRGAPATVSKMTAHRQASGTGVTASPPVVAALTVAHNSMYAKSGGAGQVVRLKGSCGTAKNGCVNVHVLQRYLGRLHEILQQRLAGLVKRDLPSGAGPVVLSFVAVPNGGVPIRVNVLKASATNGAGRQLSLALQGTPLPSYPKALGSQSLSFKIALYPTVGN